MITRVKEATIEIGNADALGGDIVLVKLDSKLEDPCQYSMTVPVAWGVAKAILQAIEKLAPQTPRGQAAKAICELTKKLN